MSGTVAILGDGIAACCCAYLLNKRGLDVSFTRNANLPGPTLLLNSSTQNLIADVFGIGPELFADLPVICKRIVLWGSEPELTMPHSGVVIQQSVLLQRLWEQVQPSQASASEADWFIHSTAKNIPGTQHHFGSRMAASVPVQLQQADNDACWVESLDSGWLFLIPCGSGAGSLLAVGNSPENLLAQSRLVAKQVECETGPRSTFAAFPRIQQPLCAANWLTCGSGAMSFDPICGEGAGHAIREAILASAVTRSALADPANAGDTLEHYISRLLFGFLRHLQLCQQFYLSARRSAWWDAELNSLQQGLSWVQQQLSIIAEPKYQLAGFDLKRFR